MKKILFLLVMIIVYNGLFGQIPPGYQERKVREKIRGSLIIDSTLHIPRYCGEPVGVRVGGYVADGALAMDTCNNLLYIYSSSQWIKYTSSVDSLVKTNDSTLIINGDTIHLGTTNNYYLLNDSLLITCDTVQNICIGDSCYTQQLCDTISIPRITSLIYDNGILRTGNRIQWGVDDEGDNRSFIYRNTWIKTGGTKITFMGGPASSPLMNFFNTQWTQINPYIASFRHYGAYHPGWQMPDSSNEVELNINYTNPHTIPTLGANAGDSIGLMGDEYGYLFGVNLPVKNNLSKQSFIFFKTFNKDDDPTDDDEAISIGGNEFPQTPYYYSSDSTFKNKKWMGFRTNKQVRYYGYGSSSVFKVDDTTNYKPLVVDATGNQYRFNHWPGGGGGSSLQDTYVGFGSDANTLKGNNGFRFDTTLNLVTIDGNWGGHFDADIDLRAANTYNNLISFYSNNSYKGFIGTIGASTGSANANDIVIQSNSQRIILSTAGSIVAKMIIDPNSDVVMNSRLNIKQGNDVASVVGAIALGFDGNSFEITGTNAITLISNIGWQNGAEITLWFTSTASLTDGTANSGTDIGIELNANTNFTGSAGASITLQLIEIGGTQRWREKCRSVN